MGSYTKLHSSSLIFLVKRRGKITALMVHTEEKTSPYAPIDGDHVVK